MPENQKVLIAIIAGTFFVGAATGYSIYANFKMPSDSDMVNQIMQDPHMKSQMMSSMMQDSQFVQDMMTNMRKDHQLSQDLIKSMMNDPALRLQMMGHMAEDQEFMQEMMKAGMTLDMTEMMGEMGDSSSKVDFSNIQVTDITATSVTIIHNTDKAVSCQVEYGIDSFTDTATDSMSDMSMPHKEHKIVITGLMPDTTYNYRLKAMIDEKTFYSEIAKFTTAS